MLQIANHFEPDKKHVILKELETSNGTIYKHSEIMVSGDIIPNDSVAYSNPTDEFPSLSIISYSLPIPFNACATTPSRTQIDREEGGSRQPIAQTGVISLTIPAAVRIPCTRQGPTSVFLHWQEA